MLMDEPLAGLDARSRQDVLDVLDMLDAQGIAVMVATHDLALAADVFFDFAEDLLFGHPRLVPSSLGGPCSRAVRAAHSSRRRTLQSPSRLSNCCL